jgi:hypothetical protein
MLAQSLKSTFNGYSLQFPIRPCLKLAGRFLYYLQLLLKLGLSATKAAWDGGWPLRSLVSCNITPHVDRWQSTDVAWLIPRLWWWGATCSSETSVELQLTVRRYIPEEGFTITTVTHNWPLAFNLCVDLYTSEHCMSVQSLDRVKGKAKWRGGSIAPPLLTSALDGGERSAWRSCRFNPREIVPSAKWIGNNGRQSPYRPYWEEKTTGWGKLTSFFMAFHIQKRKLACRTL